MLEAATTATPTTSPKIRVLSDFIKSPLVDRYLEIWSALRGVIVSQRGRHYKAGST